MKTNEVSDLLYGVKAIAAYLNLSRPTANHLHDQGRLPTFNLGRTVCARKGTLDAFMQRQEGIDLRPPRMTGANNLEGGLVVLVGLKAIADYLGRPLNDTGRRHEQRLLPTYLDDRRRICASIRALDDHTAAMKEDR